MTPLDSMGTLAELAITVIGFTGVVVALRSGPSTPIRTAFLSMLFGFGVAGVVWALLPSIVLGLGVPEGQAWRGLSIAFAAAMLLMGAFRRIQARTLGTSLDQLGTAVRALAAAQLAVLVVNVFFGSAALFLLALLSNLSIGILLFWKLIEPSGARPSGVPPESTG